MEEKKIGEIKHYFTKLGVAVIKLKDTLTVGDQIHIKGHTSDFKQKVSSIQVEHEKLESAKKGMDIGLKTKDHTREGDIVYKLS